MGAHPGSEGRRGLHGEYMARCRDANGTTSMGARRAEQVWQLACRPVTLLLLAALAEYGQWAARRRSFGSRPPARLGLAPQN